MTDVNKSESVRDHARKQNKALTKSNPAAPNLAAVLARRHQEETLQRRAAIVESRRLIDGVNPMQDDQLAAAIKMVIDAGFSRNQLAPRLGLSGQSVGRWAKADRIPDYPLLRSAALEVLKKCLDEALKGDVVGKPTDRLRPAAGEPSADAAPAEIQPRRPAQGAAKAAPRGGINGHRHI